MWLSVNFYISLNVWLPIFPDGNSMDYNAWSAFENDNNSSFYNTKAQLIVDIKEAFEALPRDVVKAVCVISELDRGFGRC